MEVDTFEVGVGCDLCRGTIEVLAPQALLALAVSVTAVRDGPGFWDMEGVEALELAALFAPFESGALLSRSPALICLDGRSLQPFEVLSTTFRSSRGR